MTGIGPRLREERCRLKLSQSALGAVGGVETNAQGNYESGARSPKADYLLRINGVGVDINYVLTGARQEVAEGAATLSLGASPPEEERMHSVTHHLHRNLHGLIDALYQVTLLAELRASGTEDGVIRKELETIRSEAQDLAQASVRLIFVTSKLT